jgi:hypothetical protein
MLEEFNLNQLKSHPSILIVGKDNFEKKCLMKDIIFHYKDIILSGVIIAPNDDMNNFYKTHFPDLFIYRELRDTPGKIIANQLHLMKNEKSNKNDLSTMCIMDSCLLKDDNIEKMIFFGRHYQLTYILAVTNLSDLPLHFRFNFDYIFLLKDDSVTNKNKLWTNFGSTYSFNEFENIFDAITKNCSSIVIDNRSESEMKMYWFKMRERSMYNKIISPISKKSDPINEQYIQIKYKDDTYELNVNITDLTNHEVIKILCDHIEYFRNNKIK